MDSPDLTPRALSRKDASALIGLLATLEGQLMVDQKEDGVPEWARRVADRLARDGLLDAPGDERELRQSINDLNQRLRYVLGEYDDPPERLPVP